MYAQDVAVIATPVGMVHVSGDEDSLFAISIAASGAPKAATATAVANAVEQLEQWLAGDRRDFDLRLAPAATARGQILRDGMIAIPYGSVESYGAFARRVGSSPRAIGQVCARNPFPVVIPCHRVLARDGIGHYSAGDGVSTKAWLLDHERRHRSIT